MWAVDWGDGWAVRRGSWHLQYSFVHERKERHRVVKRAEIVLLESIEKFGMIIRIEIVFGQKFAVGETVFFVKTKTLEVTCQRARLVASWFHN